MLGHFRREEGEGERESLYVPSRMEYVRGDVFHLDFEQSGVPLIIIIKTTDPE